MSLDNKQLSEFTASSSILPISQTQPDVTGLISDIFGDDDDEIVMKPSSVRATPREDNEKDSIFGDSDDEKSFAQQRSRLQKGSARILKKLKSRSSSHALDDDDEKSAIVNEAAPADRKRRGGAFNQRIKKRRRHQVASDSAKAEEALPVVDSGDEYDSEVDVALTAEDRRFIDDKDDQADIVNEYDEDQQDFRDERPSNRKQEASKKTSSVIRMNDEISKRSQGKVDKANLDPLSETLEMIKRPKTVEMTEAEMARIATDLMVKMDLAAKEDDELFKHKEPAVHKLGLLRTVEKIVGVKALQHTLLEYDILSVLKEWIEPKDAKTLPCLAVRASVYRMLLKLPCQIDHLKRAAPGKQPIGTAIVALRKHKMETADNKRLLKQIMEKWCRPVFGKSVDARGANLRENGELRELALQRYRAKQEEAEAQAAQAQAADEDQVVRESKNSGFNRVRTPYSSGFLFTVQPHDAGANSAAGVGAPAHHNETHNRLLKIIKDNKAASGSRFTVGKKANPRAMSMAMTGRNKS